MVTAHAPVSRPGEPTELTDAQIEELLQGEHPIVLVDGVCHFCQGATKFIIKRDPKGIFHFASIQSEVGQKLMQKGGLRTDTMDTFVLIEKGQFYTRSTAALRIARRLRYAWPLLYAFIVVPKMLRNSVYNLIARNRYRWFGKSDQCMLPTPEIRERFIE
ncbi:MULTISPECIES: thiol-disulfide oxidoreductase DCC family protein [Paenibacillus]|uniref:thiol-disulfide oxidoreductase DCC family protein n=1 Tax=Paenibacillus TaxID=44249 RepID=UPI00035F1480|nr:MULTISPECIES: thiol-disulfide oxidoreductase DCC family protein [Paenibacillus]